MDRLCFPFPKAIDSVGFEVLVAVNLAGRPADFDRFDMLGVVQAEVKAAAPGGEVASSAESMRDLAMSSGDDRDRGPDPVAV